MIHIKVTWVRYQHIYLKLYLNDYFFIYESQCLFSSRQILPGIVLGSSKLQDLPNCSSCPGNILFTRILTYLSRSLRDCSCQNPTAWPISWITVPFSPHPFPILITCWPIFDSLFWNFVSTRPTFDQQLKGRTHIVKE